MGDILNKVHNNLKDTPNKRIGDINILYLARVVEDLKEDVGGLKEEFDKKINNGLMTKIDKIWQKLNTLPCAVHEVKLDNIDRIMSIKTKNIEKSIDDKPKANRILISWLFGLYGTTILGIAYIILRGTG